MKKEILLGNEALVKGSLEAGVQFVSAYPGTPSSEIGDIFSRISKEKGVIFEFSTNEKVAMEAAIGSSFSGLKTLVAMKNFGLNICQDALLPFIYTGSEGATVVVVADDPGCHSSAQSEEDSRFIGPWGHIPILEPADPQECRNFIKLAFQVSQKHKIPVIVRITTRVAHQAMPVEYEEMPSREQSKGKFEKNPHKFITMPPRVMEMKEELLEKIRQIQKEFEKSKENKILKGEGKIGIIGLGGGAVYALEAMQELDTEVPFLKIGFSYPLPETKIREFIRPLKKILVLEELEPYLEKEVERMAKTSNPKLEIHGKDIVGVSGEIKPEKVFGSLAKMLGKKYTAPKGLEIKMPKRFPQFCEGCPYWLVFGAVKEALAGEQVVFGGDIGCYMLAGNPPFQMQDYLLCMGSSVGIGHGIQKATGQNVVAFIGDSTFFHAGIPGIINAIWNKSDLFLIVLENQITAMTGHQPQPGSSMSIENIAKACGAEVAAADPGKREEFINLVKTLFAKKGVKIILAQKICALYEKKLRKISQAV